jgi:tape measure domain-containing protein
MATATEIAILFKAQDQATSVMRNIEKSAGGLSSSLANIATSAAGFALGGVAMQAFGAAVGGAKAAVIDFNSQLEQDAIAWTTLLHNADAAQSVMIQLQQFAAQTPFEFLDVERATKRFVAMGFSAKDAIDLLTPVGNAASALGLGAAGIDRISLALGQMSAKTKVSQEEMLQLTEAGVPAWQILAEATGKPIPVLQKLSQQGELSSQTFIEAFKQFSNQHWGDAMAAQSLTFAGSLSTIKDELKIVGSTAFKPLFDALSEAAKRLAAFVQSDEFTVWGARVQAVVGIVVDAVGYLSQAFLHGLGNVLNVVNSVGHAIYQGLQWLNPFATHSPALVDQVEEGVQQITNAYGKLGSATSAFDAVGAAFENLTGVTQEFTREFGDDLPTKVEQAIAVMGPGAREAFDQTKAAIDNAKQSVEEIKVEWLAAKDALDPLKTAVDEAKDALDRQKDAVAQAKDALDRQKDTLDNQKDALDGLKVKLQESKDAYDQSKETLKGYEDAARKAEAAIKDLADAQLTGSGEFQKKIADSNIAVKQQELAFSRLKQSDAYKHIGDQIDAATQKIRELQRTEAKTTQQREEQRKAIDAQRDLIDRLKASQESLLDPAQRELDKRKDSLDAIRLERDATLGLAEDRVKAAATAALGGKELTEQQVMESIAAAKSARDKALSQASALDPQVKAQEDAIKLQEAGVKRQEAAIRDQQTAIKGLEGQIKEQERAVVSAQKAVDNANESYTAQKQVVSDLSDSYRNGKSALADYDSQLKQLLQTAELQIQKQKEAKKAADDAAKEAAKASLSGVSTGGGDPAAGIDIEGAKKKAQEFSDEVQRTRDRVTTAVAPIQNAFATISNAISPLVNWFQQLSPQTQAFAAATGGLVLVVTNLAPILAGIVPLLIGMVGPMGLLVIGVAALGAALITNLGGIRERVFDPLLASLGGVEGVVQPLIDAFMALGRAGETAFGQLSAGDLAGALGTILNAASGFRDNLIRIVASWGGAFVDWILPQVPAMLDQLGNLADRVVGWVQGQAGAFATKLLAWGQAFVEWLEPRWPAIRDTLGQIALRIANWILTTAPQLVQQLALWGKAFLDWIGPMIPGLVAELLRIIGAIAEWILGTGVPRIVETLASWAAAFLEWIVPLIPDLVRELGSMLVAIGQWLINTALPIIVSNLAKWGLAFIDWVVPLIPPLIAELVKLDVELLRWIIGRLPDIAAKLAEWGQAFIDWVKDEVLPRLGKALDYIVNGGEGWEGLVSWIPTQVKALAAALGYWAGAFVAWISDVVKNLPEELPKMIKAIGDWIQGAGETIQQQAIPIGESLTKGIVAGLGGLKDALGKTIGDAISTFQTGFSSGMANGMQRGAASGGGGEGGFLTAKQFGPMIRAMGFDENTISAICGPIAATGIANGLGKAIGLVDVEQIAQNIGAYARGAGTFGPGAFQRILAAVGIDSHLTGFQEAASAAMAGIPVAISTPIHYFLAQGFDQGTQQFLVGNTGTALRQGAEKMTKAAIEGIAGAAQFIVPNLQKGAQTVVSAFVDPLVNGMSGGFNQIGQGFAQAGEQVPLLTTNLDQNVDALKAYITQASIMRGIDPAVALNVAAAETANFTKFIGDAGSSFGPFQLHLGGLISGPNSVAGLGNAFQELTGNKVADPRTWADQIDFSLDHAAKNGWAAWHAAAATGITDWQGIGTAVATGAAALPPAEAAVEDLAGAVEDLGSQNELWDTIRAHAQDTGRDLETYLKDIGVDAIDTSKASLDDLRKASGLNFLEIQDQVQKTGMDERHWLLEVGVPAAKELEKQSGLTSTAASDLAKNTGTLQKPAQDADKAFGGLGGTMGEVATNQATQIAAVLLKLRDGLIGAGDYAGKGLIGAIHDLVDELNKIPKDVTTTIHVNQEGGAGATAGGGGGGGGGGGDSGGGGGGGGGGFDLSTSAGRQQARDKLGAGNVVVSDTGILDRKSGQVIQGFAGGGIVTGPTLAMIGEAGPEAIIPLNQLGGGIDYDRLGAAIANALAGVSLSVDVDDMHSGLLQKKRRMGSLGLT